MLPCPQCTLTFPVLIHSPDLQAVVTVTGDLRCPCILALTCAACAVSAPDLGIFPPRKGNSVHHLQQTVWFRSVRIWVSAGEGSPEEGSLT